MLSQNLYDPKLKKLYHLRVAENMLVAQCIAEYKKFNEYNFNQPTESVDVLRQPLLWDCDNQQWCKILNVNGQQYFRSLKQFELVVDSSFVQDFESRQQNFEQALLLAWQSLAETDFLLVDSILPEKLVQQLQVLPEQINQLMQQQQSASLTLGGLVAKLKLPAIIVRVLLNQSKMLQSQLIEHRAYIQLLDNNKTVEVIAFEQQVKKLVNQKWELCQLKGDKDVDWLELKLSWELPDAQETLEVAKNAGEVSEGRRKFFDIDLFDEVEVEDICGMVFHGDHCLREPVRKEYYDSGRYGARKRGASQYTFSQALDKAKEVVELLDRDQDDYEQRLGFVLGDSSHKDTLLKGNYSYKLMRARALINSQMSRNQEFGPQHFLFVEYERISGCYTNNTFDSAFSAETNQYDQFICILNINNFYRANTLSKLQVAYFAKLYAEVALPVEDEKRSLMAHWLCLNFSSVSIAQQFIVEDCMVRIVRSGYDFPEEKFKFPKSEAIESYRSRFLASDYCKALLDADFVLDRLGTHDQLHLFTSKQMKQIILAHKSVLDRLLADQGKALLSLSEGELDGAAEVSQQVTKIILSKASLVRKIGGEDLLHLIKVHQIKIDSTAGVALTVVDDDISSVSDMGDERDDQSESMSTTSELRGDPEFQVNVERFMNFSGDQLCEALICRQRGIPDMRDMVMAHPQLLEKLHTEHLLSVALNSKDARYLLLAKGGSRSVADSYSKFVTQDIGVKAAILSVLDNLINPTYQLRTFARSHVPEAKNLMSSIEWLEEDSRDFLIELRALLLASAEPFTPKTFDGYHRSKKGVKLDDIFSEGSSFLRRVAFCYSLAVFNTVAPVQCHASTEGQERWRQSHSELFRIDRRTLGKKFRDFKHSLSYPDY